MKVLVLGGSGFIGMHLVELLISQEIEFLNVDLKTTIDFGSKGQ